MAPEATVSTHYADGVPVRVRDCISIDGVVGVVRALIHPGTTEARDYFCNDTGGILYDTDKYGLMLIPFGASEGPVEKVE